MSEIDLTHGSSSILAPLKPLMSSAQVDYIAEALRRAREAPTLCHPTAHDDSKYVAKVARAAKARKVISDRVEAAMIQAVKDHWIGLVDRITQQSRHQAAIWLHGRMLDLKHQGREEYKYIPAFRTIYDRLRRLSF